MILMQQDLVYRHHQYRLWLHFAVPETGKSILGSKLILPTPPEFEAALKMIIK
jgi:hypothetical protein